MKVFDHNSGNKVQSVRGRKIKSVIGIGEIAASNLKQMQLNDIHLNVKDIFVPLVIYSVSLFGGLVILKWFIWRRWSVINSLTSAN